MKPVSATPTEPKHYVAVTAGYGVLAAAASLLADRRREQPAPATADELLLYGLATAGLTRVLSKEKIGSWVRAPFVDEPPEGDRSPRGTGLRYAIGELLCCTRCLGSWSGLSLVTARAIAPRQTQVVASLLALSAINSALQAGLSDVQAKANRDEADAQAAQAEAEQRLRAVE